MNLCSLSSYNGISAVQCNNFIILRTSMSILYRIKVRAIIRNCGFETMQVLVGKPKNINSKWIEVGGLGQSCPDNRPKYTNYYI